jgi:hypothetical protein
MTRAGVKRPREPLFPHDTVTHAADILHFRFDDIAGLEVECAEKVIDAAARHTEGQAIGGIERIGIGRRWCIRKTISVVSASGVSIRRSGFSGLSRLSGIYSSGSNEGAVGGYCALLHSVNEECFYSPPPAWPKAGATVPKATAIARGASI